LCGFPFPSLPVIHQGFNPWVAGLAKATHKEVFDILTCCSGQQILHRHRHIRWHYVYLNSTSRKHKAAQYAEAEQRAEDKCSSSRQEALPAMRSAFCSVLFLRRGNRAHSYGGFSERIREDVDGSHAPLVRIAGPPKGFRRQKPG
jgi:hypothetical protein